MGTGAGCGCRKLRQVGREEGKEHEEGVVEGPFLPSLGSKRKKRGATVEGAEGQNRRRPVIWRSQGALGAEKLGLPTPAWPQASPLGHRR